MAPQFCLHTFRSTRTVVTNFQFTQFVLCEINKIYLFFALQPSVDQGIIIHEVSRSHTTTYHSRQDSSGRVISSSQRPLPDNTLHSQQKNFHAPGGIQTHNLSRRATLDRVATVTVLLCYYYP